MSYTYDLNVPLELLKEKYTAGRMLLLNPESRHRAAFIAELMNEPFCPIYYYCMGPDDQTLIQALTSLSNALFIQAPLFGQNINRARVEAPDDTEWLVDALVKDLDRLCDQHYILLIDDFDRADDIAEMRTFVETLLNRLPPQCHLLINSRTVLPHYAWPALIARGYIEILNLPK